MDKATLSISLPRTMKDFIHAKLREGRFSTPSEYIRALMRDDHDVSGKAELAVLVRRGVPPATVRYQGGHEAKKLNEYGWRLMKRLYTAGTDRRERP